jgi:TRAP transporter 4TM/12TM fusion protein
LALVAQVHFAAAQLGLGGLKGEELPPLKKILREGGIFFLPAVVIVVVLLSGLTPLRAALWGILTTLVCATCVGVSRKGMVGKIWNALASAARVGVVVATGCASAGIVMGVLFQTGLSNQIASYIMSISGGSLFVPLIIAALLCLIVGMGVPVTASYIIVAVMIVPAATMLGVSQMAAHLFVFYFSAISFITPPVCMAAYVAAALAKANPLRVGFTAARLGIAGFIVPFLFIYRPAVLLVGSTMQIVVVIITASIGVMAIAAGLEGWIMRKANLLERALLVSGGIALMFPGLWTNAIGLVLIGLSLVSQLRVAHVGAQTGRI